MRSGIYALASLDGRPLQERDCATMGLANEDQQPSAHGPHLHRDEAFAVTIVETPPHATAIHLRAEPYEVVALLGHLDEPEDLAVSLGIEGRNIAPIDLARAAAERFGDATPMHMLGEWSFLRWHITSRTLTLISSAPRRDRMFFATDGRYIAVAPDIRRLGRLSWVGSTLDKRGFLLNLGRARLRRGLRGETILPGVTEIGPAQTMTFSDRVRRDGWVDVLAPGPRLHGGFDDAVDAIEHMLRRIMRQRLERAGSAAILLSGGLDSSLVTWLATAERRPGQELICLTSATASDSGIEDETSWSGMVARELGLPMIPVMPPSHLNMYRPSARTLEHMQTPTPRHSHYLNEAFEDAALAQGADAMFDGGGGELTVTAPNHLIDASHFFRYLVRSARRRWRRLRDPEQPFPDEAFQARLAPRMLADLPGDFADIWRPPFESIPVRRPGEVWGFAMGVHKNLAATTDWPSSRLRGVSPFLDRRLTRLVSTMPSAIMEHDGLTRAPARALMKGRLPNRIALRTSKMPFSPDRAPRLVADAPEALERVALFRAAGIDDWLDLDWLESSLHRMAAGGVVEFLHGMDIQWTALVAEFLMSWTTEV